MAVAWSKSETKSHSLTPTYTITQQSTSPSVLCTSYMCPMSMWAATTPNNYSSPYVFLTQHSSPPPPPPPVQKGLVELAREDDAQQYLIVSDNPSRISSSRSVGQSDCLYTHPYMSLEDPRRTMEGRARRRASPAGMRTKAVRVEPEPPPPTTTRRHEPGMRVAVVYYLTRNHHLEHPHFMEVPLASPQGLYLRDVIGRLDALRGKGMAAKYSWSCKRSYKTGFVWHDLSADDLLLPTQGTEFVLKGSELPFDQSKPLPLLDHQQNNATCADNAKDRLPCKPARQQESPRSPGSSNQGWTSKSPSPTPATYPAVPVMKEAVPPSPPPPPTRAAVVPAMKEVVVPPPIPQPVSPSTPTASIIGDEEQCRIPPHSGSSSNSSPKTTSMASSSGTSSPSPTKPAAAGSDAATQTDDKARWDDGKLQHRQDTARASSSPERPEIVVDEESRCTLAPAGENHRRSRRSGTLQSLIRAEAAGRRRALPLPEEDDRAAAAAVATGGSVSGRLKPANLLMRLMACGPNHPGFGLVQSSSPYRPPRFAQLEYPSSPELSPLCALKPGTTGASTVRASETENSSGRLLDGALKLSSSSSRSHHEGVVCKEEAWPEGVNNNLSRSVSKRTSDPSSGRMASSSKVVSFRDE